MDFPLGEEFFQEGTKAIQSNNYGQALELLNYLISNGLNRRSNKSLRLTYALISVFVGRYYLHIELNLEKAKSHFLHAKSLVPSDGRPYAALGSYYYVKDNRNLASKLYLQAIEKSPKQPDGYVGMGTLAENQKRWSEAENWYHKAVIALEDEYDIQRSLMKLLAQGSSNLYLQLAQYQKEKDRLNQALSALNYSLEIGFKTPRDSSSRIFEKRIIYAMKGEILEATKQLSKAADAYHEAGKLFYQDGDFEKAEEFLNKVYELNDKNVNNYWYLADTLRIRSYKVKYPFVDENKIKESLKIWKEGAILHQPNVSYTWAYIVRALINEKISNIVDDKNRMFWEAVVFIERSLILREGVQLWWAYLGRIYFGLEMEVNALQLLFRSFDEGKIDSAILDEQAKLLGNLGEYKSALEIIDSRLKEEKNPWALALKGFILFYLNEYEKSLAIFESALNQDSDLLHNYWVRLYRSLCFRKLDRKKAALDAFNDSWRIFEENKDMYMRYHDYPNTLPFYLNGFNTQNGYLNYAVEFANLDLNRKYKDQDTELSGHFLLSLTLLKTGELEEGKKHLLISVNKTWYKKHLDWIDLGLQELEQQLQDQTIEEKDPMIQKVQNYAKKYIYYRRIKKILSETRSIMKKRSNKFHHHRILNEEEKERNKAAILELESKIEEFEDKGKTEGYAWIGLNASLVRLYEASKKWPDIVKRAFQELFKDLSKFPEAQQRLESTVNSMLDMGDKQIVEENLEEAHKLYKQALTYLRISDAKSHLEIDLLSRIGITYFKMNRNKQAFNFWTKAFEMYFEVNNLDKASVTNLAGQVIGEVCQLLFKRIDDFWSLNEAINEHIANLKPDDFLLHSFETMKITLINFLSKHFQLNKESSNLLSVVTPIVIELGSDLILENKEVEDNLLENYLPLMRKRIEDRMGVKIPGVRLRINENTSELTSKAYNLMIDEVPIATGVVEPRMGFCPVPLETLMKLGIPKYDLIEASHPLTGSSSCWIAPKSWNIIMENEVELWQEFTVFIVHHLEAILHQNLGLFLGIQEAENLISNWEEINENNSFLLAKTLPNQAARIDFARLLRRLAKERILITDLNVILNAIKNIDITSRNIDEAIIKLRLRMKKELPGNQENMEYLRMIDGLEDEISYYTVDNKKIPPEVAKKFLDNIDKIVDSTKKNQVLVTNNLKLRPFIEKIVRLEFPDLIITASEELVEEKNTE